MWKTYTATLDNEGGTAALLPGAAAAFSAGLVLGDGTACQPASLEVPHAPHPLATYPSIHPPSILHLSRTYPPPIIHLSRTYS